MARATLRQFLGPETVFEIGPDGKVRAKPKRKPKYGNKRCSYGNEKFDSVSERDRWLDLRNLERAGEIRAIKRQTKYPLVVNGLKVATYVDDYSYLERCPVSGDWLPVVEDRKGGKATQTRVFKQKLKLMKACYGIDIRLTGKGVK